MTRDKIRVNIYDIKPKYLRTRGCKAEWNTDDGHAYICQAKFRTEEIVDGRQEEVLSGVVLKDGNARCGLLYFDDPEFSEDEAIKFTIGINPAFDMVVGCARLRRDDIFMIDYLNIRLPSVGFRSRETAQIKLMELSRHNPQQTKLERV